MEIKDKLLEKGEWFDETTTKNTIYIHFTAGSHNPEATIVGWDTDDVIDPTTKKKTARVVGTHFVIGGLSTRNPADNQFDGKVYRAVPEHGWIHHLGTTLANNKQLNKQSFGIEICNYGPIKLGSDGKYYNYVNSEIPASMVTKLDKPFKGYTYYHSITDKQVESLKNLILYLREKYPTISKDTPLLTTEGFDYNTNACNGVPGIYVHTNCRKDKYDWPPMIKIIDMLKTI